MARNLLAWMASRHCCRGNGSAWWHRCRSPSRHVRSAACGYPSRTAIAGSKPVVLLHDRAAQALVKLALEPEWEARFEPNSSGFRPGRSCHDAIKALRDVINNQDRWVLDADIRHCFDRISHQALLAKLHTSPGLRRPIRGWLKAGVLDNAVFSSTAEGTPQGGVVAPLLANIALQGRETYMQQRCRARTDAHH